MEPGLFQDNVHKIAWGLEGVAACGVHDVFDDVASDALGATSDYVHHLFPDDFRMMSILY